MDGTGNGQNFCGPVNYREQEKCSYLLIKSNDSRFFILLLRRILKIKFIPDSHATKVFEIWLFLLIPLISTFIDNLN